MLAFFGRKVAGSEGSRGGKNHALSKVRALPSLSAAADALKELPIFSPAALRWIAILYALHKHFCWAFFDIRNEKYELDSGLAPN